MNLLEHYIVKVISEEKVISPTLHLICYRVKAIVDCYGVEEEVNKLFLANDWEMAKKRGYYLA